MHGFELIICSLAASIAAQTHVTSSNHTAQHTAGDSHPLMTNSTTQHLATDASTMSGSMNSVSDTTAMLSKTVTAAKSNSTGSTSTKVNGMTTAPYAAAGKNTTAFMTATANTKVVTDGQAPSGMPIDGLQQDQFLSAVTKLLHDVEASKSTQTSSASATEQATSNMLNRRAVSKASGTMTSLSSAGSVMKATNSTSTIVKLASGSANTATTPQTGLNPIPLLTVGGSSTNVSEVVGETKAATPVKAINQVNSGNTPMAATNSSASSGVLRSSDVQYISKAQNLTAKSSSATSSNVSQNMPMTGTSTVMNKTGTAVTSNSNASKMSGGASAAGAGVAAKTTPGTSPEEEIYSLSNVTATVNTVAALEQETAGQKNSAKLKASKSAADKNGSISASAIFISILLVSTCALFL